MKHKHKATDSMVTQNIFQRIANSVEDFFYMIYDYFVENPKIAAQVGIGILLIAGLIGYWRYTIVEKNDEAAEKLITVLQFYQERKFEKAIEGDSSSVKGLKQIVEDYSGTKSADQAALYLGNSYLSLNKNDEAIQIFSDISMSAGKIVYVGSMSGLATAYSNLKDYTKAGDYYKKAADKAISITLETMYLDQAAYQYELSGDTKQAKELYEKIKSEFPESDQAKQVDRNLARLQK